MKIRFWNSDEIHNVDDGIRYIYCPPGGAARGYGEVFIAGHVNGVPQFRKFDPLTNQQFFVVAPPPKPLAQWTPIDDVIFVETTDESEIGKRLWRRAEVVIETAAEQTDAPAR